MGSIEKNNNVSIFRFPKIFIYGSAASAAFLSIIPAATGWMLYSPARSLTARYIIAGVAALATAALLYTAYRMLLLRKVSVEVTESGIVKKGPNKKAVAMKWDEIASRRDLDTMKQLSLTDKTGTKKINLDYQMGGFLDLHGRVFEEYRKRLVLNYPEVTGTPGISLSRMFAALFLAGTAICAAAWWDVVKNAGMGLAVFAFMYVITVVILYLNDQFAIAKQVTIDRQELKIKTLTGQTVFPLADITFMKFHYRDLAEGSLQGMLAGKVDKGMIKPELEIKRKGDTKPVLIGNVDGSLYELFIKLRLTLERNGMLENEERA